MRPEEGDFAYVWDMLDAAEAAVRFAEGHSIEDYLSDRMLRNAIERNIEIIGEAANKISQDFRLAHAHIPWRQIIAQRHVLIHEYGEIKQELIWNVVTNRIQELIPQLRALLPS